MGRLFESRCALVGMVHFLPLPGSPGFQGSMAEIEDRAFADARALKEGGAEAILFENMGDLPYLRGRVEPETVAAMAAIARPVVREAGLPAGIQVLAGANREALGVAVAAGLSFMRAEAFAYGHVADEGWLDASAGPLLRARAGLRAEVRVWADIRKKHAAHAVTADLSLAEIAKGTVFCGADALIVTGLATGCPAELDDVRAAREAVPNTPILVGSGVDPDQCAALAPLCDGLIVGTWIKHDGDWRNPVDPARVARLREALRRCT
ncbi:MAG TPA: phosphorybosylanthranilate isomerase [Myxococcales bacterium]|nr:phosphorybosylanthranilate isomerase [Myxococcales bacterium]